MSKKFVYSAKASKEAAKKATQRGKGSIPRFKLTKSEHELLVLGSVSEDIPAIFQTQIHELWSGGRPISRVASPAFYGEEDPIMKMGWKFKDKYGESSNKNKKDFWRKCMPSSQNHVNVIDLDDVEAGPQVYSMPGSIAATVLDEFNDCEDDIESICDFDNGRILVVKSNGKKGLAREYRSKFLPKTAKLLEDGRIDEKMIEEFAEKLFDLTKMQPKLDEEAIEDHKELILKAADKLGLSLEGEDEVEQDDDEFEEVEEGEDDFEDDEFDEDEGEESDDDFEEEVEEAPKKKVKKKVAKKKVARNSSTRRRRR